jgi:thiol-disulfide isomerase/thioredoxin
MSVRQALLCALSNLRALALIPLVAVPHRVSPALVKACITPGPPTYHRRMLRYILLSGLLCGIECVAAPSRLDRLKVGSVTYTNVTIVSVTATDLYFSYEKGIKNVKLRQLEPDMQKAFDFDPKTASDVEKRQTEDDARYQGTVAAGLGNRNAATAPGAEATALQSRSPIDSLADPISDRSLIGKQGPAIEVEKWNGTAPVLKGRCVLVSFLAPWSAPSRKYITQFNSFQKKYGEQLQVVGLFSEADADSVAGDGKPEFPFAVDAQAKMQTAVGVKSVPYILLTDPKGIVVYEGHPAAVAERELDAIIAKTPKPQ